MEPGVEANKMGSKISNLDPLQLLQFPLFEDSHGFEHHIQSSNQHRWRWGILMPGISPSHHNHHSCCISMMKYEG
jgi:hypothetical protein